MSIITIVFLVILIFCVWRGYQKGFASAFAQIVSLIVAYPAAIFLTNPLANFIFLHTTFTGMWVYFISGSAIFFIVSVIVTAIIKGFTNLVPANQFTRNSSKIGGAAIGIIVGGIVGLIVVYAISLTQKPKTNELNNQAASDIFIESTAKKFVSTAASTAIDFTLQDKTATSLTKAFAENPQTMLEHVQKLSNNTELKVLMSDPAIQTLLRNGDTQTLLKDWKFQHLMNNPDMQAILVNTDDTKNGKFSQQIAAEKMVAAWRRTDAIKNDPRVVAIVSDPEFQQQLNSSNKLPLMMNPKLKELTDIIFSNNYQTANGLTNYPIQDVTENTEQSSDKNPFTKVEAETQRTTIYRWSDSNGKVHYSDEPIKK